MPIEITGNHSIDNATAEIAGHVRDGRVGSHAGWTEQDHYDAAMDLRDRIMAGTRELPAPALPRWRPAVNGTGRAPWFLIRGYGTESDQVLLDDRYYTKDSGKLVRFASMENAQRVADKLNAAEQPGLLPASASPMVITDDIALNLAAIVLDAMGRPDHADELRALRSQAEGKVHGVAYQEQTGKWG